MKFPVINKIEKIDNGYIIDFEEAWYKKKVYYCTDGETLTMKIKNIFGVFE